MKIEIEFIISIIIVFALIIYLILQQEKPIENINNNINRSEISAYFINNTQMLGSLFPASKCIDGNKTSFCHSDKRHHPIIEIDLCATKNISKIRLYNRMDCCKKNLPPFILRILDENKNIKYIKDKDEVADYYDFNVGGIKGKYIQVEINKSSLEVLHFSDIDIEIN